MLYVVYILFNKERKKTYTGFTNNIEKRLKEHNSGKNVFTRGVGNWYLLYKEDYTDKMTAIKREKYFKSCAGRKFIRKLFNNKPE